MVDFVLDFRILMVVTILELDCLNNYLPQLYDVAYIFKFFFFF